MAAIIANDTLYGFEGSAVRYICLVTAGHVLFRKSGGMVFGMVITMSFVKNKKWPKLRTHAKAATSLLFVSLCVLGLSIQTVTPLQPEMDQEIIQIFTHTPMDGYARYLKSCYNKQYRLE